MQKPTKKKKKKKGCKFNRNTTMEWQLNDNRLHLNGVTFNKLKTSTKMRAFFQETLEKIESCNLRHDKRRKKGGVFLGLQNGTESKVQTTITREQTTETTTN